MTSTVTPEAIATVQPLRLDGPVEADVGRLVARDHRAAGIHVNLRIEARRRVVKFFAGAPTVVDALRVQPFEPSLAVADRPAAYTQARRQHVKSIAGIFTTKIPIRKLFGSCNTQKI